MSHPRSNRRPWTELLHNYTTPVPHSITLLLTTYCYSNVKHQLKKTIILLKTTQQNNKELITLQAKMGVQTIREAIHSKRRLSQFSPLKRTPIVSKTQRGANSEHLPYFLGYMMGIFSFQNNPKNLIKQI